MTDNSQKINILKDADMVLTNLIENEDNLSDTDIQLILNSLQDKLKIFTA